MATPGIQELTREEIRERIEALLRNLGGTPEEALSRLDRGDFDDEIASSEIRMLRFLLEEEPEYQHAAE